MFTRARAAAERPRPPASLDAPSQESQSGRRGVPRLAGSNVCLINPDCHHPQLLELRKLNQKRWLSLTIPNKPPPQGVWGAKERSEATQARRPAASGPGPDSKGILRSSITPNFDLLTFDLLKKTIPQKLGYSITPNFGIGVSPRFEVPSSMRSRGLD